MCVRDDHLSRHTEPHLSPLKAFPIQTDIAGGLQHDNLPFYISEASITLGPSMLFSWDLRPCVMVALVRRTHGNNRC